MVALSEAYFQVYESKAVAEGKVAQQKQGQQKQGQQKQTQQAKQQAKQGSSGAPVGVSSFARIAIICRARLGAQAPCICYWKRVVL